MILVLFILPEDENEWVRIDNAEEIIAKKCMYYYVSSDTILSDNSSTKTITIPKTNLIKIGTLKDLFVRCRS